MSLYVLAELLNKEDVTVGYRIFDNKTMSYKDVSSRSVIEQLSKGAIINGLSIDSTTNEIKVLFGESKWVGDSASTNMLKDNGDEIDWTKSRLWTAVKACEHAILAVNVFGVAEEFSLDYIKKAIRIKNNTVAPSFANIDSKRGTNGKNILVFRGNMDRMDNADSIAHKVAKIQAKLDLLGVYGMIIDYKNIPIVTDKNIVSAVIPSICKEIPTVTFSGCRKLKEVIISYGVEVIGRWAFSGCISLNTIVVPGSVKNIESYAFQMCTNLINIELCDGIESIGYAAFRECTNLKRIRLPSTIKHIDIDNLFIGASQNITIEIPSTVMKRIKEPNRTNIQLKII